MCLSRLELGASANSEPIRDCTPILEPISSQS